MAIAVTEARWRTGAAAHVGALPELAERLRDVRRVVVLTGAGCSTDSGIPDYRDADGRWKHRRPTLYQDFMARHLVRRRYWARSMAGWPRVAAARPNAAHHALARLEASGPVAGLITQNVDGLHRAAGQRALVELHGRLDRVVCTDCGRALDRAGLQAELLRLNPGWEARLDTHAPDGDAHLEGADYRAFRVPGCPGCGGVLKPDVVFFGESVPAGRVADAAAWLEAADALLVAGSSLGVWSGLRFARWAHAAGIPVLAVNRGRTRADPLLDLKVEMDCGRALQGLAEALGA